MRASTSKLNPGEHSIDRANLYKYREKWQIRWRIRLHDGRLLDRRTQAATKGEARARARHTANELLQSGAHSHWRRSSKVSDYLEKVSIPAMENAELRDKSKERYRGAFSQLAHQLKNMTIDEVVRFRNLEAALQNIARLHGSESARQARTVLSKYVMQQLIRDDVIEGNPLSGMSINLSSGRRNVRDSGPKALSRDEWVRVVNHLLELDPSSDARDPKRGRWTIEDVISKRRALIDLTLLQAVTGLRRSEANQVTWDDAKFDQNGTLHIWVSEEISKTHKGRSVPVLDRRVSDHLDQRRKRLNNRFIIGAPTDPSKVWDTHNAAKAIRVFYPELAETLGIETLKTRRSHVWRATLNTLLVGVNEVQRAAFFGHTVDINRTAYTDISDTDGMVAAAQDILTTG